MNEPLKAILVRAQKENRKAIEKASIFLESIPKDCEQNVGRNDGW